MLGRINSARTKEEWESFKKYLYDRERYVIELEAYKILPFGKDIVKSLNAMLTLDATTILDENNQIIDLQGVLDEEQYKGYKKKRNTILKEYFENEDPINQLNFKCYVLESIWQGMCELLGFNPISTKTVKEKKMYEDFERSMKQAMTTKEKIKSIKVYAQYISKRFFTAYPYLKDKSTYANLMTGMLFSVIILIKAKGSIRTEFQESLTTKSFKVHPGNPIQYRKGDRLQKYRRIILFIRCIAEHFPIILGAQKNACYLEDVNPSAFSKWKKDNNEFYWKIYNSYSKEEIEFTKKVIRKAYID